MEGKTANIVITLRKMRPEEFAGYREYFIEDYGREIADNYGYELGKALGIAEDAVERDLPKGPLTPGQELLCIDAPGDTGPEQVGYLWYAVQENETTAFILDFHIYEASRGRGHAKESIAELEKKLATDGIYQIKLRVAHDNKRALNLYKSAGFAITGYNMIKHIHDAPGDQ